MLGVHGSGRLDLDARTVFWQGQGGIKTNALRIERKGND